MVERQDKEIVIHNFSILNQLYPTPTPSLKINVEKKNKFLCNPQQIIQLPHFG